MMNRLTTVSLTTSLLLSSGYLFADDRSSNISIDDSHINNIIAHSEIAKTEFVVDLGWDSKYVSEGRNNLDNGGLYWATAAIQKEGVTVYATLERGDTETYINWNLGLEYRVAISDNIEASLGYQYLREFGDIDRSDNELFASLSYSAVEWLIPSITYTYSTEAAGYFVEASLHSCWPITEQLTLTPYITQAFDFQYATEAHDGANHFQFGVEAEYQLPGELVLSGHISHIIAQEDIKLEHSGDSADLNQTYMGLHLTWSF